MKGSSSSGDTALHANARVLVRGGTDEGSGEVLSARVVAERAAWCMELVRNMADQLLTEHWNAADVRLLASGRDLENKALPKHALAALRRLGWLTAPPADIYANDRVIRMAQQQAGQLLRSGAWRDTLASGIIATWPDNPTKRTHMEWDAVRHSVPGGKGLSSAAFRIRTRQIEVFRKKHGRLPADIFEVETPPRASTILPLAACDRQEATLERSAVNPSQALLRVKLPTRPAPHSRLDWSWVSIPLALPPTVPAEAALHLPVLRMVKGQLRAEVTFTRLAPTAHRSGHTIALGVDWGISTLLSAGPARIDSAGAIGALGAGAQYRANRILAKQDQLRLQSERLHAKLNEYSRLSKDDPGHPLARKIEVLREEADRVSVRRSQLNDSLAWSAGRWIVDQALAAGATAIYLEDLRSLEGRGRGKDKNLRLSQSVRGRIAERTRHLAAKEGIAVVTVPPQGTSKNCPRCLAVLRHRKAPDRPTETGWKWAICPACGWQGDRDHGAWMRIAGRGLSHQEKTTVDRTTGTMVVRKINTALDAHSAVTLYAPVKDRTKHGPTPRRRKTSSPAPRRRGTPSPVRPGGPAGQRPEGRVITARPPLPRAVSRDQGAVTASETSTVRCRHRVRGAALGAGFHLNVHATPPRWSSGLHPNPGSTTTLSRDAEPTDFPNRTGLVRAGDSDTIGHGQ